MSRRAGDCFLELCMLLQVGLGVFVSFFSREGMDFWSGKKFKLIMF